MTAVTAATTASSGARGNLETRAIMRSGIIAGLTLFLIVAVGMFEVFNNRKVIDPFLSAGYLIILWVPILFGYRISVKPVLEGVETTPPGRANIVAGAMVG